MNKHDMRGGQHESRRTTDGVRLVVVRSHGVTAVR